MDSKYFDESGITALPPPGRDVVLARFELGPQYCGVLDYFSQFTNLLAPDRYWVTPAVAKSEGGLTWHDRRPRFVSVMVTATSRTEGLMDLPFEIAVERSQATPEVAG